MAPPSGFHKPECTRRYRGDQFGGVVDIVRVHHARRGSVERGQLGRQFSQVRTHDRAVELFPEDRDVENADQATIHQVKEDRQCPSRRPLAWELDDQSRPATSLQRNPAARLGCSSQTTPPAKNRSWPHRVAGRRAPHQGNHRCRGPRDVSRWKSAIARERDARCSVSSSRAMSRAYMIGAHTSVNTSCYQPTPHAQFAGRSPSRRDGELVFTLMAVTNRLRRLRFVR